METLSYSPDIIEFRREKSVIADGSHFTAYFMHDYYPTRYQEVDDDIKRVRRMVYDFKDGRNPSFVANKISNAINRKNLNQQRNACLCIVPASASYKTRDRDTLSFADLLLTQLEQSTDIHLLPIG